MDLDWIWKAILIIVAGVLLLRISGRKSISQMTIAQTVIMISIGSLLIQPVSGKNIWTTFGVAALLIGTLVFIEYMQIRWDKAETFFSGKSKVVIEDGRIVEENLKGIRLTVDKLEMWLRQNGIDDFNKVQWATIEPSGQLGYVLKPEYQPITKSEFEDLVVKMNLIGQQLNIREADQQPAQPASPLFSEIKYPEQTDPEHLN
ncbi:DUF421 domain-containing protein [Jeotgalibacillus haloalkalitolerans]|uniref:DUF421 domain-containing protein n=1 Tax=Jeotgalibacillus haloalkalitolerans TaxID=3104292 RepID=A0ABU5KID6_9BACL|nr:DUF421 domain-containing protein [Jeotgalibacillus sp. HH7-29]MDZ5710988.1 DUF421 domain-containing protein [Jeotgalibacillus sp. HH7-29]